MNPMDLYNDPEIENETPGEDGNPTENENSEDTENPGEDENPEDTENPGEDENPEDTENPTEDETSEDTENPTEDETPEDTENPSGDENPGKDENPSEDENPGEDADPMQAILDGLRENLGKKDQDVDSLVDSVRSLVDVMSMEDAQSSDIYVPPEIPMEEYKTWDYPITVEYMVKILGYAEEFPQSATYNTHEEFLEDYQDLAYQCFRGGSIEGFYIDRITDADGGFVYDLHAGEEEPVPEEPVEDLTPAILEALQSIDSRLEIMGADLSTVSENSMAYYDDMRIMQEQNNVLQFHLLVTSIGLGFTVFLLLGYIIAHGFWQRMKAG